MIDELCQVPFLSWVALVGLMILLAAHARMRAERAAMVGSFLPHQVVIASKRVVQSESEGTHRDYEVNFTDATDTSHSVKVSRSAYKTARVGDILAVYSNPSGSGYVHESNPLSFARLSTTALWAVGWVLIFVGVLDLLVYFIIDESPWCVFVREL